MGSYGTLILALAFTRPVVVLSARNGIGKVGDKASELVESWKVVALSGIVVVVPEAAVVAAAVLEVAMVAVFTLVLVGGV